MSLSLSVYLLDVAATRALIGSGDTRLLDMICSRFADDLERSDDYFRDEIDDGAPTAEQALRAVVHGGPFSTDGEHAPFYGYAYQRICELTGSFLSNSCFTPHRGNWLETVDEGLRARGVSAVGVERFGLYSPPSPLPSTYTPTCAEWGPEQVASALEQFEAGPPSAPAPPLDPYVLEATEQCLGWLRRAAGKPGFGVVGFRF